MRVRNLLNPLYIFDRRDRIIPHIRAKARELNLRFSANGLPLSARRRDLLDRYERLASLQDRHKGRRCFVICNGPSLRMSDLDRLKDEITIASNKIYLAFDETDWRPTYYTITDLVIAENSRTAINDLRMPKIVDLNLRSIFDDSEDFLYFKLGPGGYGDITPYRFSEDFSRVAHGGHTITYINLQLAHFLGIREIYLLGLDFFFEIPGKRVYDPVFEFKLVSEGEVNHFSPDYRPAGEVWTMPRLDFQRVAYLKAKERVEAAGGHIWNASRRTKLDVFPRVEFDEVMAPPVTE